MKSLVRLLAGMMMLTLAGCDHEPDIRLSVAPSDESGELVVLFRPGPLTYLSDGDQHTGFEYELVKLFAERNHLRLVPVVVDTATQVRTRLARGEAHFAAAGLRASEDDPLTFTHSIMPVQRWLVTHERGPVFSRLADLGERKLSIPEGSSHAAFLREAGNDLPPIQAEEVPTGELEMLRRVAVRKADLTLADSSLIEYARTFYPGLRPTGKVGDAQHVAWAFPPGGDVVLFDKVQKFLVEVQRDGTLGRLKDRYFTRAQQLDALEVTAFIDRMRSLLPRYRRHFHQAELKTGIDWRLLAAVSYQESQWDPAATSYTGVQGIMQITEETAERLGVRNRRDPKEAIQAGASYIAMLRDELPPNVSEPDRTLMTLAAYNMGMGHFRGALAIARSQRINTASWFDMKKLLPKLSRPEYARRLKAGAARGGEAVVMAESANTYYEILQRFEQPYKPPTRKAPLQARRTPADGQELRAAPLRPRPAPLNGGQLRAATPRVEPLAAFGG